MIITVNLNVCFPRIASRNEVSGLHLFCNHIGYFWNTGLLLSTPSKLCSQGCSGLLGQTSPGWINRNAAKPAPPFRICPLRAMHFASLLALSPSSLLSLDILFLSSPCSALSLSHSSIHPSIPSFRYFWRSILYTSPAPHSSGIAMKNSRQCLESLKSQYLSLSVHLLLFLSRLSISKICLGQIRILSYQGRQG